jgi:hypothetical protein
MMPARKQSRRVQASRRQCKHTTKMPTVVAACAAAPDTAVSGMYSDPE